MDATEETVSWQAQVTAFTSDAPALADRVQALTDTLWDPTRLDPVITELCRLRIAQLLGCPAELATAATVGGVALVDDETRGALSRWPTDDRFDLRQKRALGWCEQYVIDPSGITDADAAALHEVFTERELTALTMVAAVFDAVIRSQVALEETSP